MQAKWFDKLSKEAKRQYLQSHPRSKLKGRTGSSSKPTRNTRLLRLKKNRRSGRVSDDFAVEE